MPSLSRQSESIFMSHSPPTPEHWRSRADELRDMAKKTQDPDVRSNLLELAESYERLAKMAEENQGSRTQNPPKR